MYALALHFCLASAAISQQNPSSPSTSTQALTALQRTYSALVGRAAITDVTLIGTVERIAGSDDETGNVTYKGLPTASSLEMTFASGNRSETRSSNGLVSAGQWTGPDGISHAIPSHNLFVDPVWFPTFVVANFASYPNAAITYVGAETRDGDAVLHLSASQKYPDVPGDTGVLLQNLSKIEIYLDSSTFLPVAITFDSHPDDNAFENIQTEVKFSDYRTISGAQFPFHVQKSVNGSLALDLQFQNASLNTGVTIAQISAQ